MISIAVEAKTKADMDKLGSALSRLAAEDPTFRVSVDSETGQTLISGMGELHLEIITDRLLREFGVAANVGRPQVSYKETITRTARAEGRYIKQTGGSGEYGVVTIEVEPGAPGSGFVFENALKGQAIPREFVPAIRQGCEEAAQSGELAGYPVVDVKVRLLDGQAHEVDSSERSFKIAGSLAMREALREGRPVLLEPLMSVEVVVPADFVGVVQGDLNARRGSITGLESRAGAQVVRAAGAARADVRLRERAPLDDAGARDLHDAVLAASPRSPKSGPGRSFVPGTEERREWPRASSSARSRT